MKVIMYHYVMPEPENYPFFRYLHIDDFRYQLDYFAATEGFIDQDRFLQVLEEKKPPPRGFILTFDDGLICHHDHVFYELKQRGLWGLFFIPTRPLTHQRLLDVHRVHVLLGRFDSSQLIKAISHLVTDEMLEHRKYQPFIERPYRHQDNDLSTREFKKIFNYYITKQYRTAILDSLMKQFFGDEEAILARDYYMSINHLHKLHRAGMILGGHSVSHTIMSTLSSCEQQEEIESCLNFLHQITRGQSLSCFCYPYGGFHSFNSETERLLLEHNCRFSFNVDPRPISYSDLANRPTALPRYDCNQFPHGQARPNT